MCIASKEARETVYWLKLLKYSSLTSIDVSACLSDAEELARILSAIVKTTEKSFQNNSKPRTKH
jgi:four helix bundle protein